MMSPAQRREVQAPAAWLQLAGGPSSCNNAVSVYPGLLSMALTAPETKHTHARSVTTVTRLLRPSVMGVFTL